MFQKATHLWIWLTNPLHCIRFCSHKASQPLTTDSLSLGHSLGSSPNYRIRISDLK